MDNTCGTLYICATPIGNMGDITIRALETLKSVDYVAAEDTRRTLKLLNRYEIKKKLISCHEHNEFKKSAEIIKLLRDGADIAYVSDAGMPAVSDPGAHLVAECIKEGVPVSVCPGVSASLMALVLSGLPCERFVFEGFLPRAAKERRAALDFLKAEPRSIIIYEAPHRIKKTLKDIYECLGNRNIAIARELTKIHEEVLRMPVLSAISLFEQKEPIGEFVLVIEGEAKKSDNFLNELSIVEHVAHYQKEGLTEAEAMKRAARDRKVPKNEIYRAVKIR